MKKKMESKVVKEECIEKESPSFKDVSTRTTRSKGLSKERCKTPDSPEGARQGPIMSPTQSSPNRPTNGASSPTTINESADSITPPLPVSAALSVPLESVQSQPYSVGNYATCITRPLVKVKRFLSTLVQFGNEIGPDVGERVRNLVLNLVSSNLSVEEFHQSLQDVTNFPLRPFVLPFLRAHLPLLQREITGLARTNKQSALQYVRTHDHVVLDPAHSPTEASEIFVSQGETTTHSGLKRRASDSFYENGINGQSHQDSDCNQIKRPLNSHNSFLLSSHQSLLLPNINVSNVPSAHFFDYVPASQTYATQQQRVEEIVADGTTTSTTTTTSRFNGGSSSNHRGDEEWRNIHVMLNCILSMVEKTKRALTILQQRNSQDLTSDWLRKQDVGIDLKKAANDIMVQAVKQTEERVSEVKRRAEEAVNDVKRQAVVELQKAVAAAEAKANELVLAERTKMEKLLSDARKHNEENLHVDGESSQSSPNNSHPAPSSQNSCWNCGRKAHETCSGCNLARYCGPFCQHKDWENHHQVCSKDKTTSGSSSSGSSNSRPLHSTTAPSQSAATTSALPSSIQNQSADSAKFKK